MNYKYSVASFGEGQGGNYPSLLSLAGRQRAGYGLVLGLYIVANR